MTNTLIPGVVYVVKTASFDETLYTDDRVSLMPDGTLMNLTAGGWLDADEVADAMLGATFEPCKIWIERARKRAGAYTDVLAQLGETAPKKE